jgi:hypothetical protein
MTLLSMVNRIKARSHRGNPTITNDTITSNIIDGIMDARRDLVRYLPKHFLRKDATSPIIYTPATVLYSEASDVLDPIIFRYTFQGVEYVLKRIESEREYYLTLFIRTQAPNRPFFYVEKGLDSSGNRQIEIYPPCDTNGPYTINYTYYKDPTKVDLTTADLSNEFPDFPSYMQDPLWKGGLFYFLKNFDDSQQLQIAQADYAKGTEMLDEIEDSDQDLELCMRWGFGKLNYRDPTTGIRLI